MRLVGVGNDRIRPEICFPNWPYQPLPYRHSDRMVHQVGLVIITIAYHPADLGRSRGSGTFTNDYHRGVGDSQLIWL